LVDKIKISRHISNLKKYLERLSEWGNVEEDVFIEDKVLQAAIERCLQMSIETCINIGNHLIASNSWRNPEDYADIFRILNENGIIDRELTESLVNMARFRNRLVYLYWDTEPRVVYRIMKNSLPDIEKFAKAVISSYSEEL